MACKYISSDWKKGLLTKLPLGLNSSIDINYSLCGMYYFDGLFNIVYFPKGIQLFSGHPSTIYYNIDFPTSSSGMSIPYSDSPMSKEYYIKMVNEATSKVQLSSEYPKIASYELVDNSEFIVLPNDINTKIIQNHPKRDQTIKLDSINKLLVWINSISDTKKYAGIIKDNNFYFLYPRTYLKRNLLNELDYEYRRPIVIPIIFEYFEQLSLRNLLNRSIWALLYAEHFINKSDSRMIQSDIIRRRIAVTALISRLQYTPTSEELPMDIDEDTGVLENPNRIIIGDLGIEILDTITKIKTGKYINIHSLLSVLGIQFIDTPIVAELLSRSHDLSSIEANNIPEYLRINCSDKSFEFIYSLLTLSMAVAMSYKPFAYTNEQRVPIIKSLFIPSVVNKPGTIEEINKYVIIEDKIKYRIDICTKILLDLITPPKNSSDKIIQPISLRKILPSISAVTSIPAISKVMNKKSIKEPLLAPVEVTAEKMGRKKLSPIRINKSPEIELLKASPPKQVLPPIKPEPKLIIRKSPIAVELPKRIIKATRAENALPTNLFKERSMKCDTVTRMLNRYDNVGNNCISRLDVPIRKSIEFSKAIGKGSFGNVYILKIDGLDVVAKEAFALDSRTFKPVNRPDRTTPEEYVYLQLINGALMSEKCPNFLFTYYLSFCDRCNILDHYNKSTEGYCSITYMEPASYDLEGMLKDTSMKGPNEISMSDPEFTYSLIYQLLIALHVIHTEYGIFHRDIKGPNILIKKIPAGGYIEYEIDDNIYYVKNVGKLALLADFGVGYTMKPSYAAKTLYDYGHRNGEILSNGTISPIKCAYGKYILQSRIPSWNGTDNVFIPGKELKPDRLVDLNNTLRFPPFEFSNDIQDIIRTFIGGKQIEQPGNHPGLPFVNEIAKNRIIRIGLLKSITIPPTYFPYNNPMIKYIRADEMLKSLYLPPVEDITKLHIVDRFIVR